MMKVSYLIIPLLVILMSCNCGKRNPEVLIRTSKGDILLELYPDKAPVTVANFIRYVKEERFQGATFYRTVTSENQPGDSIKIGVIQGGLYEDDHPQALPPIIHEPTGKTGIRHLDGVISMARNEPGTASSEFFICVGDQPSLDEGGLRNPDGAGFAAFGKVIRGMEVVHTIHHAPSEGQWLQPRIRIREVKMIE
jgi:peptidyl-prolyl cis-trans isomerase A (cyclophilin A)